MSENYKNFDAVEAGKIGDIDVTGWRILGSHVHVGLTGLVDVGFDIPPASARALAAQLIAAADYAEGVTP